MAAGPFARIIAQVAVVAGGAIARAVVSAYKEAARNGAQSARMSRALPMRRRMPLEQARSVLDVPPNADMEFILQRYEKLHALNEVRDGVGSPYLQQKIGIAKELLVEYAKNTEASKDSTPKE